MAVTPADAGDSELWMDFWLFRLALNLLGYATVAVPAALLIRHLQNMDWVKQAARRDNQLVRLLAMCVVGSGSTSPVEADDSLLLVKLPGPGSADAAEPPPMARFLKLLFCFVGLQSAYLTWGVLQEKIMTKDYISGAGQPDRFQDSQFLVFMNRMSAFALSGLYLLVSRLPRHRSPPLYKYSYASFSNIMSSWCQYEALKFVSFPTQVLAKACKVIPVMLMGKVVSKRTYHYYEYVTAGLISLGMTLFLLSRAGGGGDADDLPRTVTTFSGVLILAGYMLFDSFTSNWQGELFRTYGMSSVQMMCGVNFFSCLLTSVSLLEQGSFSSALAFLTGHWAFVWDVAMVSVCSALGQLFIFYTIAQFGAVTFVIIMTVRQAFAILLSCFIYGHQVASTGRIGILVVFIGIFLRMYCGERLKKTKKVPAVGGGAASGGAVPKAPSRDPTGA